MSKELETIQRDGYKVKIRGKSARSNIKHPFFCPHDDCKRPTSNLDDEYMEKYGVCKTCFIMYIEDRVKPLIDIEFYQKRLEERGY